jgi:hypothetical protein
MGVRWKYEDLPAHIKARVDGVKRREKKPEPVNKPQGRQPNKTEEKYRRECLHGKVAKYEGLTFRLECGHKYTPDWVVVQNGQITECHEVKGSYRFASHGRAQIAFAQARIEYPGIKWVWATQKKGMFEIT